MKIYQLKESDFMHSQTQDTESLLNLSWADLKAAANNDTFDTLIQSDDLIQFALKSGEKVAVRTTRDETGKLFFMLENCMRNKRSINEWPTSKGGWAACDMRKYLNSEVFTLLPDDLQSVIVPTTIVQIVDGERKVSEDKLFLLSTTQVYGKDDWSDVEPEDTQLDCFRHEKDYLKEWTKNGLWLRSPWPSDPTYFCHVFSGGGAFSYGFRGSYGVAFAFCIN